METKHFTREHPLILKDAVPKAEEREVICYGCQRPISEPEPAYECGKCKDYFLHKVCAELPKEIMHPKRDKHSLILLPQYRSVFGTYTYDICGVAVQNGFIYHCIVCNFGMDIACALKYYNDILSTNSRDRNIKHKGHEHSLILHEKPALFRCDACCVEDKDLLYLCATCTCPFSIHRSCALLPETANLEDHNHTLSLAYGLPSDYQKFRFDCDICRKPIFPQYWLYCCRLCRYFVHLKCMTTETQQIEANLDNDDLFHLPVRFLLRKNSLAHIQPEIKHPSHERHSLILIHEQPNDDDDEEVDEEALCNCCITPLSAPYYACVECSYFLHLPCANIPSKLHHPTHPHPLKLYNYKKFHSFFRCNNCNWGSNGFFFECDTCDDFFLDVKCAALPTTIVHENHNHSLFQFEASNKKCNACNIKLNGLAFGCETCNFSLHHHCAMLPTTIRHRWDKHPLPLRFPPYSDHPEDFICDMCEEEMYPKFWLYHCSHCDNSFHLYCVPRLGRFPGIKFRDTLKVSSHPHPLEFKRKATLKSSCDGCGLNIDRPPAFECEECNFCLCIACGGKLKV